MGFSSSRYTDLWGFFLFSHGWTWVCWSIVIVAGWDPFATPGVVFLVLGGIGPMLGGAIMSGIVGGRRELRDLGKRIVDPRLVPLRWWLVVFGFFPAVTALAALVAGQSGVTAQAVDFGEASEVFASPTALFVTAGFILILGPVPEEIG